MNTFQPPKTPADPRRNPFRHFKGLIAPRRSIAVGLCVVVASLADGFGIATLLPLMSVLGDGSGKSNGVSRVVLDTLDVINLPPLPSVLLAIVVGGVLLKGALMVLAMRQIGNAVADIAAGLRLGLVEALLRARWAYYVRQPIGRFSTSLGADSIAAGEAYNALMQMLSQGVQAIIYLAIATIVSWKLALFTLMVSALMLGTLHRFVLSAKQSARVQQELLRSTVGRLSDVLTGIKPMKAMARQARFALLFDRDLKDIRKAARRQAFAKTVNRALQEPIMAICLTSGIYAAMRVLHLPIGEVIVMSVLLAKTTLTFGKTQQELQNFFAAENGLLAVRNAVVEARVEQEVDRGGDATTLERGIEFRDVSFGYNQQLTLQNVDLSIRPGEVIALTGPSGAGKTTLVDLLLGFHRPQSGDVWIDGKPLAKIDLLQWRSLIGYVPQELILFHDSIAANLTLGEERFTEQDVEQALRAADAWDFVQRMPEGIQTVAGERGSALSGGQRQRIALARALIHRPKLLILDEATSALDPETEGLIVRHVRHLANEQGITVLSVTHHPAWLSVADRVVRLEAGTLRIVSTP